LQVAARYDTPPLQVAAAHCVSSPGYVHAAPSVPLHCPVQLPSPAQAGLEPRGAPETGAHRPSLPATSHASHCPEHAVWQQKPSTQNPLPQAASLLQADPLGRSNASKRANTRGALWSGAVL
jgi:hypothetical protein